MSIKVAMLLRMGVGYNRQIMRGVVDYSRHHGPWSFYVKPIGIEQKSLHLKEWGCNGIIGLIDNQKIANEVTSCNVPIIELPGHSTKYTLDVPPHSIIQGQVEREKICAMVARYFLDRGFFNFAFCGYRDPPWSLQHQEYFSKEIKKTGNKAIVYKPPHLKKENVWPNEQDHMSRWLLSLPKPIAMMCCDDQRGRHVIDTCATVEIKVPEEIAVVGLDNDELVCNLANPPLSSVEVNARQGGYQMAEILDQMMAGKKPQLKTVLIEPVRMITRASSDILAITNPLIAEAVRFIRQQAHTGIRVDDVTNAACVSRRKLEIDFKRILGRSVFQEIRRLQIEKVTELLRETDFSNNRIACDTGFRTPQYMCQVFHKDKGMTMRQYRIKYRIRE